MTNPSPPVRRRPVSVTFMALLVLMIAGLNLTRFVVALQQLDLLTKLLPISPYYIVLSGLVWGISALWLGLGLWGGRFIAYRIGRAAIVLYLVYFWLDRLLLRPISQPVDEPAVPGWINIDSFDLGILDILTA